jgi:hypothetical protein
MTERAAMVLIGSWPAVDGVQNNTISLDFFSSQTKENSLCPSTDMDKNGFVKDDVSICFCRKRSCSV